MNQAATRQIIVGCALAFVGLVFIVFHDRIRRIGDAIRQTDPLLRWGDWWTGEYTRGGLIVVRTIIVLFGVLLVVEGSLIILNVAR